MKRIIFLATTLLVCASAFAQTSAEEFKSNYERQVRNVGFDGVGVETIIDRWEAAFPEDAEMLVARFNYNFTKSQYSQVVPKRQKKFLSQNPTLALKDSDGSDVYYFEETFFVDSLYANALRAIDKAIVLYPSELRYRYNRITALISYEKEDPDLAVEDIFTLIDMHEASTTWTLDGTATADSTFVQGISEYCFSLFQIGSPSAYEYFKKVSERMHKLYPKEVVFIDNIGSYWQIAKKNYKQALKYYKQALKINPDDYPATQNTKIIQLLQSKKGRPSK